MKKPIIISAAIHGAALLVSFLVVPEVETRIITPEKPKEIHLEVELIPMPANFSMEFITAVPRLDDKRPALPPFDPDKIAALLDKLPKEQSQLIPDLGHEELSPTDIDAFKYQMRKCWSVPAGAKNIHKITVKIRIFLAPDGRMLSQPVLLTSMRGRDSFFRTAAESALRAIRRCQPFKMPAEKYHAWKEMVLTFSAAEMLES